LVFNVALAMNRVDGVGTGTIKREACTISNGFTISVSTPGRCVQRFQANDKRIEETDGSLKIKFLYEDE
jgi:hypothetical protein